MAASLAVLKPTDLRLPLEPLNFPAGDGVAEALEETLITDLDLDLTPTDDKDSDDSSNDACSLLFIEHSAETSATRYLTTPASNTTVINAEWKRLSHLKEDKVDGETEKVVIQVQPKRLSEADLILQPSQVEELLGKNSVVELRGSKVDGRRPHKTTCSPTSHVPVQSRGDLRPSPTSPPVPLSPPHLPRRTSWWDGFRTCLHPVVGLLKYDKKPVKKREDCEIPFADIRELDFIGSGSQGAVFAGEYLGEKVAVKKVKDVTYCQEAVHMRKLSHINIVKFKGVCTKPPCYCVIMEYCPRGTLYDYIRLDMEILPPQVVGWARQIAAGMQYLHSKKIIHRDLKSLNILISEDNMLKISDFGVSRLFGDRSTKMTFVGTVAWMAPEIIRHELCSEKVDMWSYGVLLWEILMQERPYNNINTSAIIWGVGSNNLHLPIPCGCPIGLKILMEMCWQPKPKNRPSFKQILIHLDLAAGAFLAIPPDTYHMTQESWRAEVEQCLGKLRKDGIPNDSELFHKREEELKHAQDVRLLYEQKLQTADKLYKDLRSCKSQLEAKEMELQRKEKQLNDFAYKMKRGIPINGGAFPSPLDTAPVDLQTSDTSDYQDGGHPSVHHVGGANKAAPSKLEKTHDSGRRKIWKRKRRQSACKEDKSKDCGFSEKVLNLNRLSRRQSLPPLNSIPLAMGSLPSHMGRGVASHALIDAEEVDNNEHEVGPEGAEFPSRDSTPRPRHSGTPISPSGTLSLEVTELIESVRSSFRRTHRRSGSTGSIRVEGSKSSIVKTTSLEASPLKMQFQADPRKMESKSPCRGSSSEIPFSNMDTSGSDSESKHEASDDSPTPLHNLVSNLHFDLEEEESCDSVGMVSKTMTTPPLAKDLYSNESSMDTHESDGEGNEADAESTSDGMYNNMFDRFSGTEPNETASPAGSDEVTSCSTPESSDNVVTDTHSHSSAAELHTSDPNLDSGILLESRSRDISSRSHEPVSPQAIINDPFPLQYPVSDHNILTSTTLLSGSWFEATPSDHGHNLARAVDDPSDDSSAEIESAIGLTGLSIPVHIRRVMSPESDDAGSVTPTAPKPNKLNSMTTIIRSFFENVSSKPKHGDTPLHHQSSELDDSGFQSPQAGLV